MIQNIKKVGFLAVGAIAGAFITVAITNFIISPNDMVPTEQERKPIHWVAPMDPGYKRDKPGKSPMGMDLIPVYAETPSVNDAGPGTIRISPEVVNNLGVRTVTAERRSLHSEIKTVGYVQYDEDRLIHIHPRVEGWIEKLYIKASGDPVTKGQPLYEIYSPALVNAQEELILALGRNNPRLLQAAEERLKSLRVPSQAIQKLKRTKQVTQTITQYAPQNGVVDNLNIREGFFVKPGTTLMSIGTLDQVWVEAEIFEREAFQIKNGLPVTMTLDFLPGREWQGMVDYIYPTLDAKTRTIKVRLRFRNDNNELKPNMFTQVVIHAKTIDTALLVPKEAVIRTGSSNRVVLVLGDGYFKSVKVKTGRFDSENIEILSGLDSGNKIVSSAQFLLDSESSKTSDFKRMNRKPDDKDTSSSYDIPSKIWVEATINSLMEGHRMINVTHQAIQEWKWPIMTMDFIVAENVFFSDLKEGMTLHIEIEKVENNQYLISNVHIPTSPTPDTEADPDTLGNNIMNHDSMDHSKHNL